MYLIIHRGHKTCTMLLREVFLACIHHPHTIVARFFCNIFTCLQIFAFIVSVLHKTWWAVTENQPNWTIAYIKPFPLEHPDWLDTESEIFCNSRVIYSIKLLCPSAKNPSVQQTKKQRKDLNVWSKQLSTYFNFAEAEERFWKYHTYLRKRYASKMGHSIGATPQSFGWSNPCLHLPITLVKKWLHAHELKNKKIKSQRFDSIFTALNGQLERCRGSEIERWYASPFGNEEALQKLHTCATIELSEVVQIAEPLPEKRKESKSL